MFAALVLSNVAGMAEAVALIAALAGNHAAAAVAVVPALVLIGAAVRS